MAQKVEVLLVCDLHDEEVEGAETVSFGLDGSTYEIDACEEHAAALRDAFAPYVGGARRAGRAQGAPAQRRARSSAPAASAGGGAASKERTQEIREWGRANGHAVNDRGRLPGAVIAAYEAAH